MDYLLKECKAHYYHRSLNSRTKLKLCKALAVAAAKFVAGRQTRYLKEQENATKQTKQVARSIAIGVQNFWKVIETIVIQRKQSTLKVEFRHYREEQERKFLSEADKFAKAITKGLKSWKTGLDPYMIQCSRTPIFINSESQEEALTKTTEDLKSVDDTFKSSENDLEDEGNSHGTTTVSDDKTLNASSNDTSYESSDSSNCSSDLDEKTQLNLLKEEATMSLDVLKKTFGIKDQSCDTVSTNPTSKKRRNVQQVNTSLTTSPRRSSCSGLSSEIEGNEKKRRKTALLSIKRMKTNGPIKRRVKTNVFETMPSLLKKIKIKPLRKKAVPVCKKQVKKEGEKEMTPVTRPQVKLLPGLCPLPFLLRATLRTYQHEGLTWILTLHDNNANGILADEMGLGKTIQTIALMAYLACYRGIWGPHLVVAPSSVLMNWENEFHRFLPGFKVLTYYGGRKEREKRRQGWTHTKALNVCIVSYSLVVADAHIFKRKLWYYLVLDEAQHIKNFHGQKWQTLLHFNSQRRILLTGTPLQNDLIELWSLMHFLMPQLFQSHSHWKEMFSDPLTQAIEACSVEKEKNLVSRLHDILRPFILRRLKRDVEAQMPSKYEHIIRCILSQRQKDLYNEFIERPSTKQKMNSSDYFGLLNILLQLRKICNHPDLLAPRELSTPLESLSLLPFVYPKLVHLGLTEPWTLPTKQCLSTLDLYHPLTCLATNELMDLGDSLQCQRFKTLSSSLKDDSINSTLTPENTNSKDELFFPYLGHRCEPFQQNESLSSTYQLDTSVCTLIKTLFPSQSASPDKQTMDSSFTDTIFFKQVGNASDTKYPLISSSYTPIISSSLYNSLPYQKMSLKTSQCPLISTYSSKIKGSPQTHSTFKLHPENASSMCPPLDFLMQFSNHPYELQGWVESSCNRLRQSCMKFFGSHHKNLLTPVHFNDSLTFYKDALNKTCRSMHIDLDQPNTMDNESYAAQWSRYLTHICLTLRRSSALKTIVHDANVSWNFENSFPTDSVRRSCCDTQMRLSRKPLYNIRYNCFGKPFRLWLRQNIWKTSGGYNSVSVHRPADIFVKKNLSLSSLEKLCKSQQDRLMDMSSVLSRYLCVHQMKIHTKPQQIYFTGHPLYQFQLNNSIDEANDFFIRATYPFHSILLSQKCLVPSKWDLQRDSGKMMFLATLLSKLKAEGHKCVLFCQMARVLDLLERFFNLYGYTYVRLDGSTMMTQRQRIVDIFNTDAKIFIFMSSTRAGGMGLNLIGGDTVIFYDTDWNPAMDRQAMDRCHRIGQTRDVHVYRLITEYTIEENIFRKQLVKRTLDQVVVDQGQFTTSHLSDTSHMSVKDLLLPSFDSKDIYVTRTLHETSQKDIIEELTLLEKAMSQVEKMEQLSHDIGPQDMCGKVEPDNDLRSSHESESNLCFSESPIEKEATLPHLKKNFLPSNTLSSQTIDSSRETQDGLHLCFIQLNPSTCVHVTQVVHTAILFLETFPTTCILQDMSTFKQKLSFRAKN